MACGVYKSAALLVLMSVLLCEVLPSIYGFPAGCVFEQWGTLGRLGVPDAATGVTNEKELHCVWRVRAPSDYKQITMKISRLKLPRRLIDCGRGYLLIVDLRGKVVEKLCGGAYPRVLSIRGRGADITYHSKERNARATEFAASWVASREDYDDKSCGMTRGFERAGRRHRYMSAGIPVPSQMMPWIVKIVVYFHDWNSIDGESSCAGTLVDAEWVLTSITCAFPDKKIKTREVHVGTGEDLQVVGVSEARMYPYYNGQMSDDVALIHLDKKLSVDYGVRPACLQDRENVVGGSCWIADRSPSSSWTLRVTQVQLWQNCLSTKSTVCTMYAQKPEGACRGATGGAVMCSSRSGAVGIYGVLSRKPGECGAQFEGFVNIRYYDTWIKSIVNGSEPRLPGIYQSNFIDPIHSDNENHRR